MTLMERLAGAFETRQRTASEQYWQALTREPFEPELLLNLAERLGKTPADIEADHALLSEYTACQPQSFDKVRKAARAALAKSQKLGEEAGELKLKAQKMIDEAVITRDRARHDLKKADEDQKAYESLQRELAAAGHPEAVEAAKTLDASKSAERHQKVVSLKRDKLERDIAQAKHLLSRAKQDTTKEGRPAIEFYESKVKDLESRLGSL